MTREYCPQCDKAIQACFCHKLNKFTIDSQIIILQHPTEKGHPLGTAKIAELSLDKCKIIEGEDFSNNKQLNSILQNKNCCLVFPKLENPKDQERFSFQDIQTYIVIDGTWKKAKKILFLNPQLEQLPRLSIQSYQKSNYILRKEPKENYLSTLEATIEVLKIVENKDTTSMLEILKFIQDFQIEKMGLETFKHNYLKD